jgi:hypothetical protein
LGQGLAKEVGWLVDEFKDKFETWKMFLLLSNFSKYKFHLKTVILNLGSNTFKLQNQSYKNY